MADPEAVEPSGYLIGYARVSTEDQHLDLQMDALTKYGVPRENIHTDQASGAHIKRPGFIAMMKDLRPGDILVIWKLDRLGRDLSQLLQTADRLRQKQVRMVVLTEAIDTSTPMGRFMFGVMGSFAQLEREMIQERTKAGLLAARARGRIGGRRPSILPAQIVEAKRLMTVEGLSVKQAAAKVKISRTTLYKQLEAPDEPGPDSPE